MREQLHIWIHAKDHLALKAVAEDNDEPVAALIRRLIRHYLRERLAERRGADRASESKTSTCL